MCSYPIFFYSMYVIRYWCRSLDLRRLFFFCVFFKQKTAYEVRISDWSSDVCSSDLRPPLELHPRVDRPARHAEGGLESLFPHLVAGEIGSASCRERVCQYV